MYNTPCNIDSTAGPSSSRAPFKLESNDHEIAGGGHNGKSKSSPVTYPSLSGNPRPKLTTTLWEDEGTICYQVDVNGVCVARRQDNDMVNGTKLLNIVGMSRGKRDGILKNERGRVVVRVGPMHLKGVWITFARAKLLASQHEIQESLYPLFVDDPNLYVHQNRLPAIQYPHSAHESEREDSPASVDDNEPYFYGRDYDPLREPEPQSPVEEVRDNNSLSSVDEYEHDIIYGRGCYFDEYTQQKVYDTRPYNPSESPTSPVPSRRSRVAKAHKPQKHHPYNDRR